MIKRLKCLELILNKYSLPSGFLFRHIQTELERYKGICEDMKVIENEEVRREK
jgi:hypothetical protein